VPAPRRSPRALPVIVLLTVVAVACAGSSGRPAAETTSTTTAAGGTTTSRPTLRWRSCPGGECATLPVPLDVAQPDGPTIELAVMRVPAEDREHRIGSLVVNPGGPGASGVDYVRSARDDLPPELRERFDVVGFDPRGTGASTHVDCGAELDYLFAVDTAPDDASELAALEHASDRFAGACATHTGALLAHISSLDTARDMDRLRAALGDPALTFLGYSYGTYLGALYAQQFPTHVRALVLDGAIDPALDAEQTNVQQALGFAHSLRLFLSWCGKHRGDCGFATGSSPGAAYESLRQRIERAPITGRLHGERRSLGPTQFDIAVSAAFYGGEDANGALAEGLAAAQHGDPGPLLEQYDEYVGRTTGGRYGTEWPAFLAISCLDGPAIGPPDVWAALQQRAARAAPDFGPANVGLNFACAYWRVPAVAAAPMPVHAPDAPPIVVIGTTSDPATPFAWAQGLAAELGPRTRLVAVTGDRHTSFPNGTGCLDDAVVRYLVHRSPPRSGLRCG
jgi:pimeloyl-ACP methyl ester carboxylesterase